MAKVTGPFLSVYAVGKFYNYLISRQGKENYFIMYTPSKIKKKFNAKQRKWMEHWARLQFRRKLLAKIPFFYATIGWSTIPEPPKIRQADYNRYLEEKRHSCGPVADDMWMNQTWKAADWRKAMGHLRKGGFWYEVFPGKCKGAASKH